MKPLLDENLIFIGMPSAGTSTVGRTSGSVLLPSLFAGYKDRGLLKPPERIARLAVFLASEESNTINGENGTEKHCMSLDYKG